MQTELFHESLEDAFRAAVSMLGGFEAVGHDIFPAKSRKAAGILLSDILNPDRPNKFSLEELALFIRIARDRGVDLPMHALCDEGGYERPPQIDRDEQQADYLRQVDGLVNRATALIDRIERIRGIGEVREIKRRQQ